MMNERFLSKAKRKDNSKWIDGCYCEHEHMGKTIAHNILVTDSLDDFYPYEIDVNTLCQCTGLWDDTGKLIYENDKLIVKIDTKKEYETVVIWLNGKYVIESPEHHKALGFPHRDLSECCDYGCGGKYDVSCKVIGNIHD